MIRAAGILYLDPKGKVLLLKRGAGSDHPNEWVTPGGQAKEDETLEACAVRESAEEAGPVPPGKRIEFTRRIAPALGSNPEGPSAEPQVQAGEVPPPETPEQVDFTTFLQHVEDQFTPALNYEHNAWGWFDPKEPPSPLHPGTAIALRRLYMNELDVADAMAAGELTSPQRYNEDLTLFAMRITGTGLAYRTAGGGEYVWRDSSIYMNEPFLRRCSALPVIWEHPEKTMLNTKEYRKRTIGAIFIAYFKGDDEVWGIAKIQDNDAAELMAQRQLSTSPGVTIKSADSGRLTEGDKTILIEGQPFILDHLAVCEQGVWDKQGPPVGIQNDEFKLKDSITMPEIEKKDDGNIDQVLSRLDGFSNKFDAKFDAMQAKFDAWEAEKKAEKDKKDADEDDKRRDAWKKDASEEDCSDADFEKKCDDWEKSEKNKDKAKDARKDAAEMRKDRKDAKDKKDAEETAAEKEKENKAANEKIDADKKDAVKTEQTLQAVLEELRALKAAQPLSQNAPEYQGFGDAIAICDEALIPHNKRARQPHIGETVATYMDSVLSEVKSYNDTWKDIDLRTLAPKLQMIAAAQIKDSSVKASMSTDSYNDGELRPFEKRGPGGHTITEWRGKGTFIRNFSAPSKRAAGKFLTQRQGA